MSCGGMSSVSPLSLFSFYASSTSTEKSQSVNLLSAEHTANTESSLGSNYILVIGAVCHLILVMGSICWFLICPAILRSHTLNSPLSSPDANKNLVVVFPDITLTSQSWAMKDTYAFCWVALKSHSFIVLSVEHEARTCSWEGENWTSSTEPLCPERPTWVSLTKVEQPASVA